MAQRSTRSCPARAFPKTLVILATLAALSGCDRAPTPAPSKPAPTAKPTGLPNTAQSFETAKQWLYEKVYGDHAKTFYCGCDYTKHAGQAGAINLRSCGVTARQDPARAQRLEAEHVFPAAQFGNFRPCWREPERFPDCVKNSGQTLTGRQCCEKVDPV